VTSAAVRRRAVTAFMVLTLAGALTVVTAPLAWARDDLPPFTARRLDKVFRADVQPLGLVVQRGTLQNVNTYESDPEGTHLALYVAPRSSEYSDADYVRNFTELVHRFVPRVFDRWKGLESFDICQEPTNDTQAEPPPVTQVFVKRDALDRVGNWRTATLRELVAATPRVRKGSDYFAYFASSLRDEPTLEAAIEASGRPVPTAPAVTPPSYG
jgi:hypothetical protein